MRAARPRSVATTVLKTRRRSMATSDSCSSTVERNAGSRNKRAARVVSTIRAATARCAKAFASSSMTRHLPIVIATASMADVLHRRFAARRPGAFPIRASVYRRDHRLRHLHPMLGPCARTLGERRSGTRASERRSRICRAICHTAGDLEGSLIRCPCDQVVRTWNDRLRARRERGMRRPDEPLSVHRRARSPLHAHVYGQRLLLGLRHGSQPHGRLQYA